VTADAPDDAAGSGHAQEPVAPSTGSVVRDRFSSDEVFQRIVADADHEITSGGRELFFAGVAGGLAITITFLLYASMSAQTDSSVLAALLYPIGFIYIIVGGYQLYTENTLPPVALTLERLASLPALLRHWTIVFAGNFAGGTIGALVLAYTGVFDPAAATEAVAISEHGALHTDWWDLFFKGAFAGLIVAGVVWVDFAARDTISRVVVVYLAFLAIPMGNLFHSVVSVTEAMYLVFLDELGLLVGMFDFVLPVLLGNTIGGVVLVTVVNYYQTSDRRLEIDRFRDARRLSVSEWLLGSVAGRSYVPLFDSAGDLDLEFDDDPGSYQVLVAISNPRTETGLVELAAAVASDRENATVRAVHVVQPPERTSVERDSRQYRRIVGQSERLMEDLGEAAADYDVAYGHATLVSNRPVEDVFDAAERAGPDLVVMGWGEQRLQGLDRAERPLHQLTTRLPCDFLVLADRALDVSRVLLPTTGGPDSDLSADVARALRRTAGASVTLLHVGEDDADRERAETFLAEWATGNGLGDADREIATGDVEDAIVAAATGHSLVVMGATERGVLSRLVGDSLHVDVAERVDASVLLAERPTELSLRQRLFGRK